MKKTVNLLLSALIVAAWLLSPAAVLAQDEVPPTQVPPVEEPVAEAPAEETSILETLPESVEVVVLDVSGEEVSFNSLEGQAITSLADPMYCVCGVPVGDPISCFSYTTLTEAVAQAKAYGGGCGMIYIDAAYNAVAAGESTNTSLVIDEDDFDDEYSLTIWGGWDLTNFMDLGTSSTLDMPLQILDFNNPLSSVTLLQLVLGQLVTSPSTQTVYVYNADNVTLDDVTINDTSSYEAIYVEESDNFTISDFVINESGSESAIYFDYSDNATIADGVIYEADYGAGVYLYYSNSAAISAMEIYENYYGHGIYAYESDQASISNTYVSEAGSGHGIYMYYSDDNIVNEVEVSESGDRNGIYAYYSWGDTFADLYVYEHGSGNGIYLDDALYNDFTNTHFAEMGDGNGLYLDYADFSTFVELTVYEEDDGNGIKINDSYDNIFEDLLIESYGSGNAFRADEADRLNINNAISTSYDRGNGFNIYDTDDITLKNVIASSNAGNGVHFSGNTGMITILNSTFNSNGTNEELIESGCGAGIYIEDHEGSIVIDSVTANGNAIGGLEIGYLNFSEGFDFSTVDSSVDISNSQFNGNLSNYFGGYTGIMALATGSINLENVETSYNYGFGTLLISGTEIFIDGLQSNNNFFSGLAIGDLGVFEMMSGYYEGAQAETGIDAYVYNSTITENGLMGIDFESPGTLYTCNVFVEENLEEDIYIMYGTWVELPAYMCAPKEDTGAVEQLQPILVPVKFETERGLPIGAAFAADRGMVFLLQREEADGSKTLMGQASLPGGSVPVGTLVTMTEVVEATLPAALPDGTSYVGPAFTMAATGTDGIALKYLNGTLEVKFLLPDGLTIPEGQRLAIQMYQDGLWTTLPTFFGEKYATAYTGSLGTFVLSLVPLE